MNRKWIGGANRHLLPLEVFATLGQRAMGFAELDEFGAVLEARNGDTH